MSTAETKQVAVGDRPVTFIPAGEVSEITLTIATVKRYLCKPTKSGTMPTDSDVVGFMMLCRARLLNPWVADAYLVGYDSKDGPQFSLITSAQSLLKRAELHGAYNGMESGVVVGDKDGNVIERAGDIVFDGERLIGGWARVHRKDQSIASYDSLKLSTFNTGRSRWAADPAGMIVKCAESSALRKCFPTILAGLYCREEFDATIDVIATTKSGGARKLAGISVNDPLAIKHEHAETLDVPTQADETETVDARPRTATKQEAKQQQRSPLDSIREEMAKCKGRDQLLALADELRQDPSIDDIRADVERLIGDALNATK